MRTLPEAEVLEFQAQAHGLDSFFPMEVVATQQEVTALLAKHKEDAFLLFPEDRCHPIRMSDDLPKRWIDSGSRRTFDGEAQRNEFYVFQVGVYASGSRWKD